MSSPLLLILLTGFAGRAPAKAPAAGILPPPDARYRTEVPLYGNGYVYPASGTKGLGVITAYGLRDWTNPLGYTRTFFLPVYSGEVRVSLEVPFSRMDSHLQVDLDSTGLAVEVYVPAREFPQKVFVGTFGVSQDRYHYIEIKGDPLDGEGLPDIEGVILSGPGAKDLLYNENSPGGALTTFLSYPLPMDSTAEWFYNEVSVPEGNDPPHAYYMADGFAGGYFGIQAIGPSERAVVFGLGNDAEKEGPANYSVTLLQKGEGVITRIFGNGATEGVSLWPFLWNCGTTYRLLVRALPSDTHTTYSAWFYAPEKGGWKFIASWDKSRTKGGRLNGLFSFLENSWMNGNDYFKAKYGNQWIRTPSGTWIELTRAVFGIAEDQQNRSRYDLGGGAVGDRDYLFTGGFREIGDVHNGSFIDRQPGGTPPEVDFGGLPLQ